ncbi:L-type lectin-domain containing receptor kinase S.4-like [Vicia villosa]|uniref:L-type lectin-domain containing receptor kinase S.4-like n=1 Tax=Vicia villosa TaxID=3911 RepID=UPI00273BD8DE|nr:L-type lectin-domain containing receptor kinase S.4-like [Vicia villosa]
MSTLVQLLISVMLLFFFMPVLSQVNQFLYAGFKDIDPNNLTLNGFAEIEKNGILRLTNHTNNVMGHAFYSLPFQLKNSTTCKSFSFSSSFALAVVPEYPKVGGHGMAFTIATNKDLNGSPIQYLGLFNSSNVGNFPNHVFAVEFDTVLDFGFDDINDNHVGIDINGLKSNASVTAGYYTDNHSIKQELLNIKSGKPFLAWVDYDSSMNLVSVTLSPTSTKPKKPTLSFHVDLSPILHDTMYVGFSASTGLQLASSHHILGWSFKINGQAPALDLSSLPQLAQPKKRNTSLITGVSVTVSIVALCSIAIGIYIFRKIKNANMIEPWELEVGPHRYSYRELHKATNGFKEKELLGQGGFGRVYKGTLPNSNIQVAVKRVSHESKQGLREFVSEIASIGRLRHRNLVQLLGWCRRKGDLLLVYDFMANGSLDKCLFEKTKILLSWEQRFKIIKDVASGLLYLHEGYEQVVIHRDVKSSNVLLDFELNGRLGDFGLARLYEHDANPGTTKVVGTLGYLAPELPRTGKSSTSCDVFAFGAFLLEVTCGRRPIEPKALPEELVLEDLVWERYREGRMLEVVDKKLNGEFDESEVMMVLNLGLICSNDVPMIRPSMRQVVRILDGEVELHDDLRKPEGVDPQEGFDEFLHSLAFSSNDIRSSSSYLGNSDTDDTCYISFPSSPQSLLNPRR